MKNSKSFEFSREINFPRCGDSARNSQKFTSESLAKHDLLCWWNEIEHQDKITAESYVVENAITQRRRLSEIYGLAGMRNSPSTRNSE